jgi:hypothetical protein
MQAIAEQQFLARLWFVGGIPERYDVIECLVQRWQLD